MSDDLAPTALTGTPELNALVAAARRWAAGDVDDGDAAALRALAKMAEAAYAGQECLGGPGSESTGGPDSESTGEQTAQSLDAPGPEAIDAARRELAQAMGADLEFGTAGLRGPLGPGRARMNRSVVVRAAAALVDHLHEDLGIAEPAVVIGYDARHRSDVFARDTAAVVTAAGGHALVLPEPLPTPVLAWSIRRYGADAGVMVTASHNPAADNGYKVYLGDGAQIVPPTDALIAARIATAPPPNAIPRADDGWVTLGDEVVSGYVDDLRRLVVPGGPRQLQVVHTALHGVGSTVLTRALTAAGFAAPHPVPSQEHPDADFPTVAFPNPEEAGAMDAALELATRLQPDLVIASDPDADRCAVGIPVSPADDAVAPGAGADTEQPRAWRMLTGDETGALLAWHVLRRGVAAGGVLASSIVSSRLLPAMAAAAGVEHAWTLTGFKWIARVPGLAYGYEEALGYCVAPGLVRDKDGISAAVLVAEAVAALRARGRDVQSVLDELATSHGVHATDAFSVRTDDLDQARALLRAVARGTRTEVAGVPVVQADDLVDGVDGLPPTVGLRRLLADGTRIIVRPSGTEPKVKVYLEAVVPVEAPSPANAGHGDGSSGGGAGGGDVGDARTGDGAEGHTRAGQSPRQPLAMARAEAARRLARVRAAVADAGRQ